MARQRDPWRPMTQLPAGERLDVMHACPVCPIGAVRPWCRTCAGSGVLTALQLSIWQRQEDEKIRNGG